MKRIALVLLAAFALAGCGTTVKVTIPTVTVPATLTPAYQPPSSSVTPDGAIPAPPPSGYLVAPSSIHVSANGALLVENFEGWSSCPYWDGYGGVWTRGFGETEGIWSGSPCISRTQGQANLIRLLETRYMWAARALGIPLNQNQVDSLASTLWNLGAGIIGPGTQLGELLRAHNYQGYANALLAYDHAGGVVLEGLRNRRIDEARLFLKSAPVAKPSRAVLLVELRALRADRLRHHCAVPPKYGGGRYHRICRAWTLKGAQVNRELKE